MVDYQLLMIAQNMPDHATPPARMSGGDMPMWDADMSYWMDDVVVHRGEEFWQVSVSWDRSKLTVLRNPRYKCVNPNGKWEGVQIKAAYLSGEISNDVVLLPGEG